MRSIIYPYAPGAAECGTSENLTSGYPAFLAPLLPKRARDAIRAAYESGRFSVIEEIRLRREVTSSLTTDRGTVLLPLLLLGREMDETLTRISGGSLYAHSETIGEGYLILNGGVRVGICGRAAVENGKVIAKGKDGASFEIESDTVVLSVGYNPAPLAKKKAHVHVIGDADKVGNLRTVIWGAWDVCMKL